MHVEAARQPFLRPHLQRVVNRTPGVEAFDVDGSVLRVPHPEPALNDGRSLSQRRRGWEDPQERIGDAVVLSRSQRQVPVRFFVQLKALELLQAQHAGVGRFDHDLGGQLSLDAELPLLAVRTHAPDIEERQTVSITRGQAPLASLGPAQSGRKWIGEGVVRRRAVVDGAHERCNGVEGGHRAVEIGIERLGRVEQAVAAAQHRLSAQAVSEAEARPEVVAVHLALAARIPAHGGEHQAAAQVEPRRLQRRRRVVVEAIGDPVEALGVRRLQLIPDAEVQRQLWGHLPLLLDERRQVVVL